MEKKTEPKEIKPQKEKLSEEFKDIRRYTDTNKIEFLRFKNGNLIIKRG